MLIPTILIIAASLWFLWDGYRQGKELARLERPTSLRTQQAFRINRDSGEAS